MHFKKLVFLIPAFIFLCFYSVTAADYIQVAGLIDLRTTSVTACLISNPLWNLQKKGALVFFLSTITTEW